MVPREHGMRLTDPELLHFDRRHVWHPYSSAISPSPAYLVESAKDSRLRLHVDGAPR
jgi:adenosylmethionine-8-amino-7-oxononanoate aminotransferase